MEGLSEGGRRGTAAMTHGQACRWAQERLADVGIEEARWEARCLWQNISGLDWHDLLVRGGEALVEADWRRLRSAVEERAAGRPLQYILGSWDFFGLSFEVGEEALIPRQDTEVLVEAALPYVSDGGRILDLCTGSGCILISLMHARPEAEGVGADISAEALALARSNGQRLLAGRQRQPRWLESDLFSRVEGRFSLIISNPPYIPSGHIDGLMAQVRDFEPRLALDGGEDGLDFYRKISRLAPEHLEPGGALFLEIGHDQQEAVMGLLEEAGFGRVSGLRDLAGLPRVVFGFWPGGGRNV